MKDHRGLALEKVLQRQLLRRQTAGASIIEGKGETSMSRVWLRIDLCKTVFPNVILFYCSPNRINLFFLNMWS